MGLLKYESQRLESKREKTGPFAIYALDGCYRVKSFDCNHRDCLETLGSSEIKDSVSAVLSSRKICLTCWEV